MALELTPGQADRLNRFLKHTKRLSAGQTKYHQRKHEIQSAQVGGL